MNRETAKDAVVAAAKELDAAVAAFEALEYGKTLPETVTSAIDDIKSTHQTLRAGLTILATAGPTTTDETKCICLTCENPEPPCALCENVCVRGKQCPFSAGPYSECACDPDAYVGPADDTPNPEPHYYIDNDFCAKSEDRIAAVLAESGATVCPILRDKCVENRCQFWTLMWNGEANERCCTLAKAAFKIATGVLI